MSFKKIGERELKCIGISAESTGELAQSADGKVNQMRTRSKSKREIKVNSTICSPTQEREMVESEQDQQVNVNETLSSQASVQEYKIRQMIGTIQITNSEMDDICNESINNNNKKTFVSKVGSSVRTDHKEASPAGASGKHKPVEMAPQKKRQQKANYSLLKKRDHNISKKRQGSHDMLMPGDGGLLMNVSTEEILNYQGLGKRTISQARFCQPHASLHANTVKRAKFSPKVKQCTHLETMEIDIDKYIGRSEVVTKWPEGKKGNSCKGSTSRSVKKTPSPPKWTHQEQKCVDQFIAVSRKRNENTKVDLSGSPGLAKRGECLKGNKNALRDFRVSKTKIAPKNKVFIQKEFKANTGTSYNLSQVATGGASSLAVKSVKPGAASMQKSVPVSTIIVRPPVVSMDKTKSGDIRNTLASSPIAPHGPTSNHKAGLDSYVVDNVKLMTMPGAAEEKDNVLIHFGESQATIYYLADNESILSYRYIVPKKDLMPHSLVWQGEASEELERRAALSEGEALCEWETNSSQNHTLQASAHQNPFGESVQNSSAVLLEGEGTATAGSSEIETVPLPGQRPVGFCPNVVEQQNLPLLQLADVQWEANGNACPPQDEPMNYQAPNLNRLARESECPPIVPAEYGDFGGGEVATVTLGPRNVTDMQPPSQAVATGEMDARSAAVYPDWMGGLTSTPTRRMNTEPFQIEAAAGGSGQSISSETYREFTHDGSSMNPQYFGRTNVSKPETKDVECQTEWTLIPSIDYQAVSCGKIDNVYYTYPQVCEMPDAQQYVSNVGDGHNPSAGSQYVQYIKDIQQFSHIAIEPSAFQPLIQQGTAIDMAPLELVSNGSSREQAIKKQHEYPGNDVQVENLSTIDAPEFLRAENTMTMYGCGPGVGEPTESITLENCVNMLTGPDDQLFLQCQPFEVYANSQVGNEHPPLTIANGDVPLSLEVVQHTHVPFVEATGRSDKDTPPISE